MANEQNRVCPVECANSLDNRLRRWLQNPRKLLAPYLTEGMTVLDIGCGPGFFTLDIADMVGASGRVIAADLQDGMLQKVRAKILGTVWEPRIILHQCQPTGIGLSMPVDFVFAFYMAHEVPDHPAFFTEVARLLASHGRLLIVEPMFHVSHRAFTEMMRIAGTAGLQPVEHPRYPLSRAVLLQQM